MDVHTPRGSPKEKSKSAALFCGRNIIKIIVMSVESFLH